MQTAAVPQKFMLNAQGSYGQDATGVTWVDAQGAVLADWLSSHKTLQGNSKVDTMD